MKVISELSYKKSPAFQLKNPVLPYLSLSLLVLLLFVLLTACDDRTKGNNPTVSASASSTTNSQSGVVAAPSATVSAQLTQTAAQPSPTPQPAPTFGQSYSSQVDAPPAINFWPQMIEIGQKVQLSGQHYPANTRLNIHVASADLRSDTLYGTILTDEDGYFTTNLKLEPLSVNSLITPGKVEVAVTTLDGRIGASGPLALHPAPNASLDDVNKNLVSEFFAAYRRDTSLAAIYLSTGLREQLATGQASLKRVFGSVNPPLRVEISKVKGATASYQAVLYSAAENKNR